jgi:hypothetical protein
MKKYLPALRTSKAAARLVLKEWEEMAHTEATQRGIADIFKTRRWNRPDTDYRGQPILGEDLELLRIELGLSHADAGYLYGLNMGGWSRVVRRGEMLPVVDVTLALIVRALRADLTLSPIPPTINAQKVYDAVTKHVPLLDKKRFGIMFGREATSGYRWLMRGISIGAEQERIFRIFHTLLGNAERSSKNPETRARAAMEFLIEWDNMVKEEATLRGVPDIYLVGRWVAREGSRPIVSNRPRKRAHSPRPSGQNQIAEAAEKRFGPNFGALLGGAHAEVEPEETPVEVAPAPVKATKRVAVRASAR